MKQILPFLFLTCIALVGVFIPTDYEYSNSDSFNAADIAWVAFASSLVFLMTPGLAYFYGGMINQKNIISTMIKSFAATGLISLLWIVVGYSLAFGTSYGGFIGSPTDHWFFKGVAGEKWAPAPTIPLMLFALFQMKFAIITPAIIVGAVAERIRFMSYILFILLFSLLVYAPIAHWTWHPEGILYKIGMLDFAGGTVVHITAGCAALVGALVLKKRKSTKLQPANVPYVLLGTGLLWFGWFGFNAGSSLEAGELAISAFTTTNTASGVAGITWILFDYARGKKPTVLGFCIGAIVGLVAITPGAGFVAIPQSIFIGFISAVISNLAVHWKEKTGIDDTLDVFPCHGIGGIVGCLLTGIFATTVVNPDGADGLWYGSSELMKAQIWGLLLVMAYSSAVSYLIFKFLDLLHPIRVTSTEETTGLDISQHNNQ